MRLAPNSSTLSAFTSQFLVACPNCAQQAVIRDRGVAVSPRAALTCTRCGHNVLREVGVNHFGGPVGAYFLPPLREHTRRT